jgi:tryptophan-rich sensory protein
MRKYLNVVFFAGVLIMNYLANALPINGKDTGELSDQYPNLFVPAGLTFSIWGVIYLLLIVTVASLLFRSREKTEQAIGWWFIANCIFNMTWILAWHYEQVGLSLLIMLGLLVSLAKINQSLAMSTDTMARLTFGIYLGWICIATIANVTTLLVSNGWHGALFSESLWTMLLILVGTGVVIWLMRTLGNFFLALAVCWAFLGIILKRGDDYPAIAITAGVGLVLVAAAAIFTARSAAGAR